MSLFPANPHGDSDLAPPDPTAQPTLSVEPTSTQCIPNVDIVTPLTCRPSKTYKDYPGSSKKEQISNMRKAIANDIPRNSNGKGFKKIKNTQKADRSNVDNNRLKKIVRNFKIFEMEE